VSFKVVGCADVTSRKKWRVVWWPASQVQD